MLQRVENLLSRRGIHVVNSTPLDEFMRVDCSLDTTRIYYTDTSIGKKDVLKIVGDAPPSEVFHLILICSRISRQSLHVFRQYHRFELLSDDDLVVQRLDHKYVPKYRKLDVAETEIVRRKYGNCNNFPRILANIDAAARLLGFQVGDVIEARISCPFRGPITEYRYVT